MRRQELSLVGIIVDTFMEYISPQKENSFSTSRYRSGASVSVFDSEKVCLLIFVFALVFIALISPILCVGSLFFKLQVEGLWYFWFITLSDAGYLAWLFIRKKAKSKERKCLPWEAGHFDLGS